METNKLMSRNITLIYNRNFKENYLRRVFKIYMKNNILVAALTFV